MRFTAWIAAFLGIAAVLVGCDGDKKVVPVPGAGEIAVQIVSRTTANTPETEFTDVGGILSATYTSDTNGAHMEQTETQSFSGGIKIPAKVNVGAGVDLSLSVLEILSRTHERLAIFTLAAMENLLQAAQGGVRIVVVVTEDGSVTPELRTTSAAPKPADPKYKSIRDIFPDPQVILTNSDTAATLAKLKEIASPTAKYHEELLAILGKAESVDTAHLQLLIDACYFTAADYKEISSKLAEELKKNPRDEKQVTELRKQRQKSVQFAPYAAKLLELGFPIVSDLNFDSSMALLARQFGGFASEVAFQTADARLSPLSAEQKLKLMNLALEKGASATAATIATDWYKQDSDRSIQTLLTLVNKFSYDNKDSILTAGLELQSEVSVVEAVQLVNAAYVARPAIAASSFRKIRAPKVTDLVTLAGLLSYDAKDSLIQSNLSAFDQVSADELRALVKATYTAGSAVGKALVTKIPSLTGSTTAELATLFSYDNKDSFLFEALKTIKVLTVKEVEALVHASYTAGMDIGLKGIEKIPGKLTANEVAELAGLYSYDNKDTLIYAELPRMEMLSTQDLITLSKAAYLNGTRLIIDQMNAVTDLNTANTVKLAGLVSYDNKDTVVVQYFTKVSHLSAEEVIALSSASYQKGSTIILGAIEKVNNLTVANAVSLVGHLSYDNKDTFLLKAVERVTDLAPGNLMDLANAAYGKKQQVIEAGLKRLSGKK